MCWCDPSIRTPCCGKPECFPKDGKSRIQIIKQQIENLQKELKTEQDNCLHKNVMYETGANTGNYDPSSDCYWNDVQCIDCGKHFRFDSEEDPLNYKLQGQIGCNSKLKKEDYNKFLEIQKQLGQ